MFTLSLAHATLVDVAPPDLVRIAAAAGYQAVGLRLIPLGRPGERRYGLGENPGGFQDLKRALDETGVRFLDIELIQIKDGAAPRSYLPALERAAELGCLFGLVNVYTPDRSAAQDRFAEMCELTQPLGLTMALEPVSFSEVSTLEQAVDVVRACDRDNAAVLVDTLHFHSSRAPLGDLAELPADRVHFVHVCDGPRDIPTAADDLRRIAREERLLPGEGGIDVAGILRGLPPDIIYAVEVHNPARAAALGAEAYARLAFEKTTRYLDACLR